MLRCSVAAAAAGGHLHDSSIEAPGMGASDPSLIIYLTTTTQERRGCMGSAMLLVVVQPAQQVQQRGAQSIFPMGGPAGRCGAGWRFGRRSGSGPKPLGVLTVS